MDNVLESMVIISHIRTTTITALESNLRAMKYYADTFHIHNAHQYK